MYVCVCMYRKNFLKIQLFYSEISYSSLEQSPAYDTETLLGMVLPFFNLRTDIDCITFKFLWMSAI